MKTIQLTQNKVALIDDEDFDKVNQYKWYYQKASIGYGYATSMVHISNDIVGASIEKRTYLESARNNGRFQTKYPTGKRAQLKMHRLIMDSDPSKEIDHINHNTLDNRKENLRIVNRSQNTFNRKISKNNTSGYKGVFLDKESKQIKYRAMIGYQNKLIRLGRYSDIKDAARAYNAKALELYGEYANLNIV